MRTEVERSMEVAEEESKLKSPDAEMWQIQMIRMNRRSRGVSNRLLTLALQTFPEAVWMLGQW